MGTARRWWPDYLFHFTDIQNAVSILKTGALFSRVEATRLGLMATDNASQDIIANTDDELKNYVRLYFRPKTPTQFRNEGFRPVEQRWQGSHCPVPIYFLFDSREVLSHSNSLFTNGNLASRHTPDISSDASDLMQMDFRRIYSDPTYRVREAQSEIVVPKRMTLDALRRIACRSQAEYETFLYLLPESERRLWGSKIGVSNRMNLFHKRWTYVQSAELHSSHVVLNFNKAQQYQDRGTFHADVSVTDTLSGRTLGIWSDQEFTADDHLRLSLSNGPFWDYTVRLSLDRQIAYADRYQDDSLPW